MSRSLNVDRYTKAVVGRLEVFYPPVNGFAICSVKMGKKRRQKIG
jgi:hypothetical protein